MTFKSLLLQLIICNLMLPNLLAENPCGTMYPVGKSKGVAESLLYPNTVGFLDVYLYDDTTQKVGSLKCIARTIDNNRVIEFEFKIAPRWQRKYLDDIEMVSHTTMQLLKVYETCNGFFRILENSTGHGVFIDKNAALELFQNLTYKQILFNKNLPKRLAEFRSWGNIGVNLRNNCLRLRTLASIDSDIIECIPGNDIYNEGHAHMTILETQGDWLGVEVLHYRYNLKEKAVCADCGDLYKKERGWMKAVDDSGFLNLWFSYTSY